VYFSEDPNVAELLRRTGEEHGYRGSPMDDSRGAGPGLVRGARIDTARAVDLNPTLCVLLGIRPAAGIDGNAIRSILSPPGGPGAEPS
jgi:hypothetical protein